MTIKTWDDLSFWQSDAWNKIRNRLDEEDKWGRLYNPKRELLFAALDATPLSEVKAVLVAQDPYPRPHLATGLAYSVPRGTNPLPPTLANVLEEYSNDLHYPYPKHGDLACWARRGVLLWNSLLSVGGEPLSHNWVEWHSLTAEVLEACDRADIPMVFMGGVARDFAGAIRSSPYLLVSHPSPRGIRNSRSPFRGSRPFTFINSAYPQGSDDNPRRYIDWRIPDVYNR